MIHMFPDYAGLASNEVCALFVSSLTGFILKPRLSTSVLSLWDKYKKPNPFRIGRLSSESR